MGAEDFAYMLMAKPGCYAFIANGDGDHRAMGHGGGPCMLHNPSYDFNDQLIPLGATYWVRLTEAWLPTECLSMMGSKQSREDHHGLARTEPPTQAPRASDRP